MGVRLCYINIAPWIFLDMSEASQAYYQINIALLWVMTPHYPFSYTTQIIMYLYIQSKKIWNTMIHAKNNLLFLDHALFSWTLW